jgi:ABC-type phosphate/phosphonate transport system ATPase subunit
VVIVVTHDVDAVDGLCQQLVVLAKGRVALDHQGEALAAGEILERYHDAI